MAKYIMHEMPDVLGTGTHIRYPRMLISQSISLRQIAEEVSEGTTYGRGEVEGLLAVLVDRLTFHLSSGCSVRLDGLGVFSPSLGLRPGAERETERGRRRNAQSIRVDRILFRADRDFVRRTDQACRLERTEGPTYTSPRSGGAERLERLRDYLDTHGQIALRGYVQLTGLSRSSAVRELARLVSEGLLVRQGGGSHVTYRLA